MSDDSAYQKFLRLIGRGRDSPNNNSNNEEPENEYGPVPKHFRRELERKDHYLIRNGAWLFEDLVKYTRGNMNSFRIFSLKELQKATNNFSTDQISGIIEDRHVTLKIVDWFLMREVVSLSLIKHSNVVKLLGCCLETRFPIVVHELPPNGTLGGYFFPPPVELLSTDKLRIATEIADVVGYLHLELNMTHGCLEADEAVLLDEFHSAKLGTFDFSKIQNQVSRYDVETNNIRNKLIKSDVYYFGNILWNFLTSILIDERCDKVEIVRNLRDIRSSIYEGCDKVKVLKYIRLNMPEKVMPQIDAYIDLLLRCQSSDKVPSMKEVARELRRIRSMMNHQPTTDGNELDNLSSGAN